MTIHETQKDILYKVANNFNEMLSLLESKGDISSRNAEYKRNILNKFEAMIKEEVA